jgi:hypothetical protein
MIPLREYSALPSECAVDPPGESHREALHSTSKSEFILGFDDAVDVIRLH